MSAFLSDLAYVALGGAIGSGMRYAVSVWLSQKISHGFPWHTLAVNTTGSLALGLFMALAVDRAGWGHWQLFVGIGLLGGFTTFSTFSYETIRLFQDGAVLAAASNILGSVAAALAAAAAGFALGRTHF